MPNQDDRRSSRMEWSTVSKAADNTLNVHRLKLSSVCVVALTRALMFLKYSGGQTRWRRMSYVVMLQGGISGMHNIAFQLRNHVPKTFLCTYIRNVLATSLCDVVATWWGDVASWSHAQRGVQVAASRPNNFHLHLSTQRLCDVASHVVATSLRRDQVRREVKESEISNLLKTHSFDDVVMDQCFI